MPVTLKSTLGDTTLVPENTSGSKTVTIPDVGVGKVLQMVSKEMTTQITTSAVIPHDSTPPLNTEGLELTELNLTITPKSATSTLEYEAVIPLTDTATADHNIFVLWRDEETTALRASSTHSTVVGGQVTVVMKYFIPSVSTNAQTFKIRFGGQGASMTINPTAGLGTSFIGLITSTSQIKEIAN